MLLQFICICKENKDMLSAQVKLLNKKAKYQTDTTKIFTIILTVILFLALSLAANSCFAKIDVSNLEYQSNSQTGWHPGGIFFDKDNAQKYYIKFYSDEMHARSEFLAIKIYAIFGVSVPKVYIETMEEPRSKKEKLAFISKWEDGLERIGSGNADYTKKTKDIRKQLAKTHLISVLVKNLDAGANNTLFKNGRIFVIDAGNSFRFGTREDSSYGPEASEFCGSASKEKHWGGKIFNSAFKKYTMNNTDYLISWLNRHWDEHEIKAAIKASGINDSEMIFTNLKLRFKHLKTLLQELEEDNTLCHQR